MHELPDEELTRYRDRIEAVTIEDVARVAREQIHMDRLADRASSATPTRWPTSSRRAGIGTVDVERDEGPMQEGPMAGVDEQLGPTDQDEQIVLPVDDNPLTEPLEEPGDEPRPA